jgi:hypothetical protein
MNKTQTIAEFKKRIETQNFTVSRIKNIVSMKKHKDLEDVYGQEESFGEFFYSKDINLSDLLGGFLYDRINDYYTELKNNFAKIYMIFVEDASNPKRIKYKKVSEADYDIARAVLADLITINDKFNEYCNSSFDRLYALSESKFQ